MMEIIGVAALLIILLFAMAYGMIQCFVMGFNLGRLAMYEGMNNKKPSQEILKKTEKEKPGKFGLRVPVPSDDLNLDFSSPQGVYDEPRLP